MSKKAIKRLTLVFTNMTQNYLPDAYIFAILLTLVTFISGIALMGYTPMQMANFWGDGLWNLNNFAMQMALVLIFGFTLAKTYVVHNLLAKISSFAKNQNQAIILLTLIAVAGCYINWGFGLIVSALLAVEFARKLKTLNYGLFIAAAYSGFLVWHGGLSGSVPLKLTNPNDSIKSILGNETFDLSNTIFSSFNLTILIAMVITLVLTNYLMSRFSKQSMSVDFDEVKFEMKRVKGGNFATRLENSVILNFLLVTLGLVYLIPTILEKGIGLNTMIIIFMLLGLIFHGTSKNFLNSFNESVRDSSGILLQFPFYAGIMAMMSGSGMAQALSEFFISISNENTFLFFTYISAAIVNFFVPSGGGQWALQAPIILPAAKELGISLSDASMAIAWGDAWTNMVQPFWALPLLSAARCELRQMMTYSLVIFLSSGFVSCFIILLYSMSA